MTVVATSRPVLRSETLGKPQRHAKGTRPGGIVRIHIAPGKVTRVTGYLMQHGIGKTRSAWRHAAHELDTLIHDHVLGFVQEQQFVG